MNPNPRLAIPFQQWFENQIRTIELKRKKCLVLDLDNTLWGGILGEDGMSGIALGGDYPGKAYKMFQQQILDLSRQGIILAICSKNNLEDVRQLWMTHPDVVLKEEHFALLRINWNNKADNIREIAQELNIGLDSLVFIDDNPAEREIVKNYLPEVTVPDFPGQPYQLPLFFKELAAQYFSIYALTEEDKQKTEQYKANTQRSNEQRSFTNLEEYICNLKIELKIAEVNNLTLTRAAQMTQKTNQFNLTTHRYTDADLSEMLQNKHKIFTLSVSDKFGDSGITGLCIVQIVDRDAYIDSLLLSCRILGKNIENAFLSFILKILQSKGIKKIAADYIPSAKNAQVIDFYEKNGFTVEKEDENRVKHYTTQLSEMEIKLSNNYTYL
jgi:FkbH-like protein